MNKEFGLRLEKRQNMYLTILVFDGGMRYVSAVEASNQNFRLLPKFSKDIFRIKVSKVSFLIKIAFAVVVKVSKFRKQIFLFH